MRLLGCLLVRDKAKSTIKSALFHCMTKNLVFAFFLALVLLLSSVRVGPSGCIACGEEKSTT